MTAVLFPQLGIIFAFVVAASCAMSQRRGLRAQVISSACLCSPRSSVRRSPARAWPRGCFNGRTRMPHGAWQMQQRRYGR
jgi:hypothetical protein